MCYSTKHTETCVSVIKEGYCINCYYDMINVNFVFKSKAKTLFLRVVKSYPKLKKLNMHF